MSNIEFDRKNYQYLLDDTDDFNWLDLPDIPKTVYNPLFDIDHSDITIFAKGLVKLMMNPDYIHVAVRYLLGKELLPFQLVILDMLWKKKFPMLIAGRGSGKSFMLAVYIILRLLFNPGCKVVVVGAALRQSRGIFDYIVSILDKSPVLADIIGGGKNGPKREPDRFEFRINDSIAYFLPLGTGEKIRGYRANYIIADEYASIPSEIFNVTVRGFGSTSSDPVEKVKRAATIKQLKKIGRYTEDTIRNVNYTFDGNQVVISGTASYSFNHFCNDYEKHKKIIASKGDGSKIIDILGEDKSLQKGFNFKDYAAIRIGYNHIPDDFLDEGMISQAKATMNIHQFSMEYGSIFCSDTDGFYKRSLIENATCYRPIVTSSGERVQFSAMKMGEKNRNYIIAVDPAAMQDNAAVVVLEDNPGHRKVVYCWSTNKKKFDRLRKDDDSIPQNYYAYLARRIRDLMRCFSTSKIVMDFHGGGLAVAEALGDPLICKDGEHPIYEEKEEGKDKYSDSKEGLHIIRFIKANTEYNSAANHGLKKDLESKTIIFPFFDTIEAEKQLVLETYKDSFIEDTYEDIAFEIDELKNEITNIVCVSTGKTGQETFDTPEFKVDSPTGAKKGRMRKDRYSALLYGNQYLRDREKNEIPKIDYIPMGGTMGGSAQSAASGKGAMYFGPGVSKFKSRDYIRRR
jgi:hypothetical protein